MDNKHMPRYDHEACDDCIFLGEFEKYDLYVCTGVSLVGRPTIIARYGDMGQYDSGLDLARSGQHPALYEGYLRAKRSNILGHAW